MTRMGRWNNKLPHNLPQLQNLIKRDAESYKEEFLVQYDRYKSLLEICRVRSTEFNMEKDLEELIMFLAQVAHCYPNELSLYAKELLDDLGTLSKLVNQETRKTMCRAIMLMRGRGILQPTEYLEHFYTILFNQEKSMRVFLKEIIISDLKRLNAKSKNHKLNTAIQNIIFSKMQSKIDIVSKFSLDILIELYRKNVWRETRIVNIIADACFSETTKIMVTAVKFFLTNEKEDLDEDSDNSDNDMPTPKEIMMKNRVNKKTRKRGKQLSKAKTVIKKKKKNQKSEAWNFSALHMLYDPQDFAEKLFKRLGSMNERFEVKLMFLELISRLIGVHKLILLNFYPFVKRYLQPHQREVTKILVYAAQSAHDLIPPDVIEEIVQGIMNNFVTERNAGEVIAVGLNAIREICARCPLAMSRDVLEDLSMFSQYKEKSVMMASRSLIMLFRQLNPSILHKKVKGKPTLASSEKLAKEYGALTSMDYIPGAETLMVSPEDEDNFNTDEDSDSDEWVNVSHSEDEEEDDDDDEDKDDEKPNSDPNPNVEKTPEELLADPIIRKEMASGISTSRILTDEDFKRISTFQLQKEVTGVKRGSAKKRKASTAENTPLTLGADFVDLASIEMVHKKRRHDKESRLETVMKGREGREKFGKKKGRMNPNASTTDKEKRKKKNFSMVKHKIKRTKRRSFKEQQSALRNSLLKQKRAKK